MWYKRAQVGDKIVCVKHPTQTRLGSPLPSLKIGTVYIIKELKTTQWEVCDLLVDVGFKTPLNKIRKGEKQPVSKLSIIEDALNKIGTGW